MFFFLISITGIRKSQDSDLPKVKNLKVYTEKPKLGHNIEIIQFGLSPKRCDCTHTYISHSSTHSYIYVFSEYSSTYPEIVLFCFVLLALEPY